MKISIGWLKEFADLNCSVEELAKLLPLRTIGIKEVTEDYIELDMKGYNRADLLSMRGVAYEVAAITGSNLSFKEPQEAEFVWNKQTLPQAKVTVSNPEYAPIYTITKITGLKARPSPREWVEKLAASGLRSVDNITDVTNLIMLEYGQPMHAFDAKAVKDESVIVRTAKQGERITTLDGKTRDLGETDLLIADPLNALGIAGVMGGKDSEVNVSTATILLEAAIFDPVNIKKTTTGLGLPSEASKRFQHGLTKKRLLQALNAAIKMYQELGGKLTALSMVGNLNDPVKKVELTEEKLNSLIGVEIKPEEVGKYLTKLGFSLSSLATQGLALCVWEVTVPYWRLDIELEEDVIEEVARMYGYEKIPAAKVSESEPLQKEDPIFQKISTLKKKLVDLGLTEVQTYSFYSTGILNALGFDNSSKNDLVKVANPISSETEYLRENLWPNLVEIVGRNMRKGYKDIGIFEIGRAFNVDKEESPTEDYRLAIALCNGTENPLEELYQIVRELNLHSRSVGSISTKQAEAAEVVKGLFHPKRFMDFEKNGKQIGTLAEVHLRVLNKLGVEKRVAVLEVEL